MTVAWKGLSGANYLIDDRSQLALRLWLVGSDFQKKLWSNTCQLTLSFSSVPPWIPSSLTLGGLSFIVWREIGAFDVSLTIGVAKGAIEFRPTMAHAVDSGFPKFV